MDRATLAPVLGGAFLSAFLIACSGCGSPGDDYQTLTEAEAEQIDAAREEARRQAAKESGTDEERTYSSSSDLVLVAAQVAAGHAKPEVAVDATVDEPTPNVEEPPALDVAERSNESLSPAEQMADLLAKRAAETVSLILNGESIKREIKLLVPERSFSVEGSDGALRVSYDDLDLLKVLNMEPVPVDAVDYFPQWLNGLDGKQIRIRGFMYPTFEETGIQTFALARDNQICCFGRNPKIYDLFPVFLRKGETTDYIQGRPFDVVGTFRIAPDVDDDKLWQLYEIDDAVVIDE